MSRFAAGPFRVQGVESSGEKVVVTYANSDEEVVINTSRAIPYLDSRKNLYVSTNDQGLKPYKTVMIPASAKKKRWDEILGATKVQVSRALRSKVVEPAPPAAEVPAVSVPEEPVKVEKEEISYFDLPVYARYKEKLDDAKRILDSLNIDEFWKKTLTRYLRNELSDVFSGGYIYIGDKKPWNVRVRYYHTPPYSLEALVALLLLVNSKEEVVNKLKKLLAQPANPPYATYNKLNYLLVDSGAIWADAEEQIKKSRLSKEEAEAVKLALGERHFMEYERIPPSESVRRHFFNSLERAISTVVKLSDSGPRIYYVEVGDGEAVLVSFWREGRERMLLVNGAAYTPENNLILKESSNRRAAEKLVSIAKTIHEAAQKENPVEQIRFFDDPRVVTILAPLVPIAREAILKLDESRYQNLISRIVDFSAPGVSINKKEELAYSVRYIINQKLGVDTSFSPDDLSFMTDMLSKRIAIYLAKNPHATARDILRDVVPKANREVRSLVKSAGPFAELAIEEELKQLKSMPESVRLLIARGVEFEKKPHEDYSGAYFVEGRAAGFFPSSESLRTLKIQELIPVSLVYDEDRQLYRLSFQSKEDEEKVEPEEKKYFYNPEYVDKVKKIVNEGETYVSPRGLLVMRLKPGGYFVIAPRLPT